MSELDELLKFINTSAFTNLSSDAKQEMLSKVESLKAKKLEADKLAFAEEIKRSVESTITDQGLTADYHVKIAGGKVEVTLSQGASIIAEPKTEETDNSLNTTTYLAVIFKDGELICEEDYLDTFILSLKKIGLERIPDLNITYGNINLVSIFPKDASKQTLVDGMYLYIDLTEDEAKNVLSDISNRLYLDLQIEFLDRAPSLETKLGAQNNQTPISIVSEYPNYSGIILTKIIDWSLLNYGFTVPKMYYLAVEHACGKELTIGKCERFSLIFNHKQYNIRLLKVRKEVIQILWNKSSGILDALHHYCMDTYDYMKEHKKIAKKKKAKIKLPKSLLKCFYLCTTTTKGVFILYPANNNQESNHISTSTINNTALYKTKSCNHIVLESLKWLRANDSLEKLCPFIVKNPYKPNIKLKKEGDFNLANIFLESSTEDLKARNAETIRWFSIPFTIGGAIMYPSTQWRNNGQGGLQLSEFMKMIDYVFPNTIKIVEYGNSYQLIDIRTSPQTSTQTNR